jgi:phosphoenolpyruvate synthase/pyruvate phosphate dikinase
VQPGASEIFLRRIDRPFDTEKGPAWSYSKIRLEAPETRAMPILPLCDLRMTQKYRYGTKAANLGELDHLLKEGSERLLGFYRVGRPGRPSLLPSLARYLGVAGEAELSGAATRFLREVLRVPRGIALPFSSMRSFLESSAQIQQAIGKLKMALELEARQIDSLAISLQQLIRDTRMPENLRLEIDEAIERHLMGVGAFVVRSSSNAEDLEGFSAAGLYESVNRVTTVESLHESIKQVWASLLSPRSVRLRHEVGISLEESYMGVIVQEELETRLGGVLVTTNPMNRAELRDVYFNLSPRSVISVVQGDELPYQCLFNIVEGGGRTLSLGNMKEDLSSERKRMLEKLAFAGKLLQSHFSPDYTFSAPLDIEWLENERGVYLLQVRPYGR